MRIGKILLVFVVLIFISISVNATQNVITKYSEKTHLNEIQYRSTIDEIIEENGIKYQFQTIKIKDIIVNSKEVTEERKAYFKENNKDEIRDYFKENLNYAEDNYIGVLNLDNIEVKEVFNGTYKDALKKDIVYNNYKDEELKNIPKTIIENGKEYKLIDVDWILNITEEIDGEIIPLTYNRNRTLLKN